MSTQKPTVIRSLKDHQLSFHTLTQLGLLELTKSNEHEICGGFNVDLKQQLNDHFGRTLGIIIGASIFVGLAIGFGGTALYKENVTYKGKISDIEHTKVHEELKEHKKALRHEKEKSLNETHQYPFSFSSVVKEYAPSTLHTKEEPKTLQEVRVKIDWLEDKVRKAKEELVHIDGWITRAKEASGKINNFITEGNEKRRDLLQKRNEFEFEAIEPLYKTLKGDVNLASKPAHS